MYAGPWPSVSARSPRSAGSRRNTRLRLVIVPRRQLLEACASLNSCSHARMITLSGAKATIDCMFDPSHLISDLYTLNLFRFDVRLPIQLLSKLLDSVSNMKGLKPISIALSGEVLRPYTLSKPPCRVWVGYDSPRPDRKQSGHAPSSRSGSNPTGFRSSLTCAT